MSVDTGTVWAWAMGGLSVPFVMAVLAAGRGAPAGRLPAVSLAASLAVLLLLMLSFAIDQPSSIDLALTLALLSLPGTLIFALFEERWL